MFNHIIKVIALTSNLYVVLSCNTVTIIILHTPKSSRIQTCLCVTPIPLRRHLKYVYQNFRVRLIAYPQRRTLNNNIILLYSTFSAHLMPVHSPIIVDGPQFVIKFKLKNYFAVLFI